MPVVKQTTACLWLRPVANAFGCCDGAIATTGIARGRSQGEIDRYTVWPGQATSYKIGHTVWVKLRDEAKAKAGAKFDIRQFHEILKLGAMPLAVLERVARARM